LITLTLNENGLRFSCTILLPTGGEKHRAILTFMSQERCHQGLNLVGAGGSLDFT